MTDLRTISTLPLGLRNNNPGNLRDSGILWQGRVGANKGFTVFDAVENGIRAYAVDIRSKINRGLNTINKIIPVYAPPSENNTSSYITTVVRLTGFSADKKLDVTGDTLYKLAKAMFYVENGTAANTYLSDRIIQEGVSKSGAFKFSSVAIPVAALIAIIIIVLIFIK